MNGVIITSRGNEWVRRAGGSKCHSCYAFLVSPVHEAQRTSRGIPHVHRGRHPGDVARRYDQPPIWRPACSAQVLGNALLELFSMVPIVNQQGVPHMREDVPYLHLILQCCLTWIVMHGKAQGNLGTVWRPEHGIASCGYDAHHLLLYHIEEHGLTGEHQRQQYPIG